ncbi:MAG: hypothetical protein EXQ52_08885 [Bryobacterales bacterium]|nr:hypothetical protein [Bryobacterales bacterium]
MSTRREFLAAALGGFPGFGARTAIPLQTIRNGRSKRRYLWIHGNERTARAVLLDHIKRYHGTANLIKSKTRNIRLLDGVIDPNRLFSRTGAEANLRTLNPRWTAEKIVKALDRLDRGRERTVRALLPPKDGLLIALHNNSEGYSVNDEVAISDRTSLRDEPHPHEFFLCTQAADFEILKTSPYNVVLQNRAPKEDDGSLSRLAAARGVRYVNLEVALGNAEKQREMLDWAERHLP